MAELSLPARPSRRVLLGTALWSVPGITVAAAAPAFADSGEARLEFSGTGSSGHHSGLAVTDAQVAAAGRATAPATVMMTVVFINNEGSTDDITVYYPPDGWVVVDQIMHGASLRFVSGAEVKVGGGVHLDGLHVERGSSAEGTYRLTFEATGYVPTMYSVTHVTP